MAEEDEPPIIGIAMRSWTDAFRAVAAMPRTAAIGLIGLVAVSIAGQYVWSALLPPVGSPFYLRAAEALPAQLVLLARGLVQSVLLAPLGIAIHRFVLLRQVTKFYPVGPSNARFMRYAGFAALVYVLWDVPTLANVLLEPLPLSTAFLLVFTLFLNAVILVVVIRHVVLFPAIAVDAPRSGWRQARLLTVGHGWRAFFILLCVVLPFGALAVPMHYFYKWNLFNGPPGFYWVVARIADFAAFCVLASAASHLYRAFDPALGSDARPPPTVPA